MYHQYPSACIVLIDTSCAQDCIQQATHRHRWEERSGEPPVWQGSVEVESDELEELGQEGEEGRGLDWWVVPPSNSDVKSGLGWSKPVHCATLKFRHEVWIGRRWWSDEGGGSRDEREAKQGGRAEAAALKWVVEKKSAAVTSHTIVLQRSQCLSAACHHPTRLPTPPITPMDTIRPQGPRLKTTQELKFGLAAERTEVMRKNTRTEVQRKLKCTGEPKSGWT
ncbi:hypothetical protein B0H14DRAFT_2606162 [Mycena olivaceomarginata]|nr:hypothetical protein B0H14DRAFT_2606162 [Mycena olivaceomarginata]